MQLRTIAAVGAALLLTGCSATDDETIRFATLPVTDDPAEEAPGQAIAELLAEETGQEVSVIDAPTYSAVIESVRAGHEDFAVMSGFPSAMAVNTGEVDALVSWPGREGPASRCIVLQDSPLRSLEEITPEHTVAFADPASSTGYFMPVYALDQAGLTQGEDYQVLFSGGHDRSQLALKSGDADVSCTAAEFVDKAGEGSFYFPFDEGETRVIGESPAQPVSVAVIGSQHMSQQKRETLLAALPEVFADDNHDRLGSTGSSIPAGVDPLIEPGREHFQKLADIAEVAGVDISDLK